MFHCPGCDSAHGVSAAWEFNGSMMLPSFRPSILALPHGTLIDIDLEGDELTAPSNVRQTPRCHSYVTDGQIQFLPDSTHELAGQTVELPEWPSD